MVESPITSVSQRARHRTLSVHVEKVVLTVFVPAGTLPSTMVDTLLIALAAFELTTDSIDEALLTIFDATEVATDLMDDAADDTSDLMFDA